MRPVAEPTDGPRDGPIDGRGTVARALLAIARDVPDDRALAGLICQACVAGLDIDGAGLSLFTASVASHILHATDATAQLLEELQFTLNEGVCIEAATTGAPVFVDDLDDAGHAARWPAFAAAVREQTEARAVFALPLRWGTVNLGVLDLYRRVPVGLSDEQRRDALAAAYTAASMMLTLRTEPTDRTDAGIRNGHNGSWLDPVVAGRAEVHQATGMVMAQLNLPPADALARMRGHAFATQRLLIEVARDVVARRLDFTDEKM